MNYSEFEAKIAESIRQDSLLAADGRPVIVGLSGGADSVALLSVLCRLGYDCRAIHCNFHLRGEEAFRDQHHAEIVAARLGVMCEVADFDTRSYMARYGVSLEMACRELRYDYFRKRMSECDAQAIAVAHHQDDNIETFFLNLLRGTGLRGLRGMLPRQRDVVRPLLGVTRQDIEGYLAFRSLDYVTDSTNAVNDAVRNRLRNIVIPYICQEFPEACGAIASTMRILRANEKVYESAICDAAKRYQSDDGNRIALCDIISEEAEAHTLLFELLRDRGFNASQASDMIRSCGNSGRSFVSGTHTALIDRGILSVQSQVGEMPDRDCVIDDITDASLWPVACRISTISRDGFTPRKGETDTLYLDACALDGNPEWVVRSWREGDRMKPFGMKGSRKLSDIFSDAKISVADKRKISVLTRNGEIIWVIGLRTARLFSVTDSTDTIIKVAITNTDNKNLI